MTPAVQELKVRARLRVSAARRVQEPALRLGECLRSVAREAGFLHWEHARRVLAGEAASGDDMGTFWYAPRCSAILCQWFADGRAAAQAVRQSPGFLLPYRLQFVLAPAAYVRELGLDPTHEAWSRLQRDLVAGYGSSGWQQLCRMRLQSPADTFEQR
jgi:hypothetical protein